MLNEYIKALEEQGLPNNVNAYSNWQRYNKGILYQSGGWSDQPHWYVEDIYYIELKMEFDEIPLLLHKYQETVSDITRTG